MSQTIDFSQAFLALTGHEPFPWQERLYDKFLAGVDEIPPTCDIPTGLGKTSVIAVWLIALAAKNEAAYLPRRLVYVVDRRTVVDQSTEVVEQIRDRLREPGQKEWKTHEKDLKLLLDGLKRVSGIAGLPLAVSTLRGELADNEQWKDDPRCPAIVVGTIDMIGSKLLFSGYGDSQYLRPLHAGLMGCDTLFIHDEAHLTPAFSRLLFGVANHADEGERTGFPSMMRVMELSATHRDSDHNSNGNTFTIDKEDRKHEEIKKRYRAKKSLRLHEMEKAGKEINDEMARIALQYEESKTPERVVVFVRSPDAATKIAAAIEKGLAENKNGRVSILTGEIRGYERDLLLGRPGMKPFVNGGEEKHDETVYLVATSAGEVGMDLHADHMVSDLTTLDSMIQRLGRVNRFGQTKANIDLVHEQSPKEENRAKTLEIILSKRLEDGSVNVSPAALELWLRDESTVEAFSALPEMVELTDILTDIWSQTSLNDIPARPAVAPWLHGIQDDLPETWIAWRNEVELFANSKTIDDKDISRWFSALRVGSKEKLRMPTHRFREYLSKKREPTQWVKDHADRPVVVVSHSGEAQLVKLGQLAYKDLNFATVVFSTELAGLSEKGFFDLNGKNNNLDVVDADYRRIVLKRRGEMFGFAALDEEKIIGDNAEADDDDFFNLKWESWNAAIKAVIESFPASGEEKLMRHNSPLKLNYYRLEAGRLGNIS